MATSWLVPSRPMAILVTGAGGFIGLNVLDLLLAEDHHVVALSTGPLLVAAQHRFNELPGRLTTVLGDVRDEAFVRHAFTRFDIQQVLHAAALTLPPGGGTSRAGAPTASDVIEVNVVGTQVVLDACRAGAVERFVYPSSSAVYGDRVFGAEPVTERAPPQPTGLYGMTKLAAERLVTRAGTSDGLGAVIARLTAVFGPWEHYTGARSTLSPPWQLADRARRGGTAVLATGGARDWTHSADVARALVALLTGPLPPGRVYNLGLGQVWHPEVFAHALAEQYPRFTWRIGTDVETDLDYADLLGRARSPLDATRVRQDLGVTFADPATAAARYAAWTALGTGDPMEDSR